MLLIVLEKDEQKFALIMYWFIMIILYMESNSLGDLFFDLIQAKIFIQSLNFFKAPFELADTSREWFGFPENKIFKFATMTCFNVSQQIFLLQLKGYEINRTRL